MKIYEIIWQERKQKVWSEELREKYKEMMICPKPVEKKGQIECICRICGTTFTAGSATAAYCSEECRDVRVMQIKIERRKK